MANWFLESVEITGGFLPGINLMFPRGLTCIIGPRGSGKSTLMESLRYGLAGISPVSKRRFELVQANLGFETGLIPAKSYQSLDSSLSKQIWALRSTRSERPRLSVMTEEPKFAWTSSNLG